MVTSSPAESSAMSFDAVLATIFSAHPSPADVPKQSSSQKGQNSTPNTAMQDSLQNNVHAINNLSISQKFVRDADADNVLPEDPDRHDTTQHYTSMGLRHLNMRKIHAREAELVDASAKSPPLTI